MSALSAEVGAAHFEYLARRTRGDDELLVELKRSARAAGIPEIWISPEQASLMAILLRLARAAEVVEVGTLAGYSAIAMARALPPSGRVRTIELSELHAEFAERQVARSDVAGKVEVLRGRGLDQLPRFDSFSADAVFLDADKENYGAYLRESLRILRPGGLLMVDNAFAFGQLLDPEVREPEVEALRAFNDEVAATRGLESIIVPIGDGLWVGAKT